jgi:hypothetical protein
VADIVKYEDPPLATMLWRRAVAEKDDSPEFVTTAVPLGLNLGLEAESRTLIEKMHELAAQGTGLIQALDLRAFVAKIEESRQQRQKVEELFRTGSIPIHIMPPAFRPLFAVYFQTLPQENQSFFDPLMQMPILARSGARPLHAINWNSQPEWRSHLDITALLLAAAIGVLDPVEQHISPLRIPGETQRLLLDEVHSVRAH